MTRSLAEAGTLKSASRQKFRAKAFLGAAVVTACGITLSAGSAEAAIPTTNCQDLNDLTVGNTKITNLSCTGDIAGSDNVLILYDELTNNVEYSFFGIPATGSQLGSIGYDIEITAGQSVFQKVSLTSDGSADSIYDAFKDITWAGGSAQLATNQGGAEPVFTFPTLTIKKLTILDSWVASIGDVQLVKNNFTLAPGTDIPDSVPGPLPILGAAAAFGMSRKLRSRIKQKSSSL
jgi:hypothetical protein